jgi:glycosyltransferase involved in cell wall biosynthesis
VDDGRSGFLVRPNDKQKILEVVQKLSDSSLRSEIIAEAKEKAKTFSIERTITKTAEVIFSLIKAKRQ